MALACLALTSASATQPPNAGQQPTSEDQQDVRTQVTHQVGAASVNFRKELNLPFPTLGTLGARISSARRTPDPVAMAHAANELAVAERVSGKKATLTSTQVMKEAGQLAALRRQQTEMQAVLQVAQQTEAESDVVASLRKQIADAEADVKANRAAVNRNEEPGFTPRTLVVDNTTAQFVDVFVNGFYKMQVAPGEVGTCMIEHRYNPVVLTAYGNDDADNWGPRYIWGKFHRYTWNIY
jgi:hypothetical protein